jgi:hypothetical protein
MRSRQAKARARIPLMRMDLQLSHLQTTLLEARVVDSVDVGTDLEGAGEESSLLEEIEVVSSCEMGFENWELVLAFGKVLSGEQICQIS